MRTLLSRVMAVAAGAALTMLVLPAGTAAAASSASCPATGSTRVFTGGVAGGADNKLWIFQPTSSQTIICFDFYPVLALGAGAVVLNTGVNLTPPTVTPGSNPAACTTELVRITDPAPLRIAAGAAGNTACFTINGSTTSITAGLPSVNALPSVELWSDATYTWVDFVVCERYTDPATRDACRYTVFRQI